jgi:polyhydroxyalkanoate synthesis regulator phasin
MPSSKSKKPKNKINLIPIQNEGGKKYNWIEERALESCPEILDQIITKAKSGDREAGKFILERFLPNKRRGTTIKLELSRAATPADVNKISIEIIDKVQKGELSPEEGTTLHELLANRIKIYEATVQEERIAQMERLVGVDVVQINNIDINQPLQELREEVVESYINKLNKAIGQTAENFPIEKIFKKE